jgi:cytochrome c553
MGLNRRFSVRPLIVLAFASLLVAGASVPTNSIPTWAYGTAGNTSTPKEPPDNSVHHLVGSPFGFTRAQINNPFGPADWYPNNHPKMPAIVAHGRKPEIWACSLCHYPNGKGRPENAGVAGLPVSYFIHQMHDFRDGLRKSADDRKKNTNLMIAYAKAMTDDEIQAAAEYFESMKWTPWIKVVETATVPKTYLSVGMFLPLPGGATEPLGERIIETPKDAEATEVLRNPRSGFTAYVPFGSVKRGEALVTSGAGKTVPCAVCHGAGLNGIGPVPGIAGRSPSYLVRQLYDMQQHTRKGEWTQLMLPVVRNLSDEDMLDIAAYTASLPPESTSASLHR